LPLEELVRADTNYPPSKDQGPCEAVATEAEDIECAV
jgi:hypothetical protein